MWRITIRRARTWRWARTRRWVERSNDTDPLSPSKSFPGCTINTAGYDFRKGHRLKNLVEAHEDRVARHQAFVDRIAPAARNIHAYWLATTHAHAAPAKSSSVATGRPARCTKDVAAQKSTATRCPRSFARFNFL